MKKDLLSKREIQDVLLDMVKEFDRICKKHNIKYVLDGGSMLGAVRHKGFIPWDDDIDILILRSEYNRFLKAAKTELKEPYYLDDYHIFKDSTYIYGKLKNKKAVGIEPFVGEREKRKNLFLDIFPVDNVTDENFTLQKKLIGKLTALRYVKIGIYKKYLRWIAFFIPYNILNKLCDIVFNLNNKKETEYVYVVCQQGPKPKFKRSILTDIVYTQFEDTMLPIPTDWDDYLTKQYGDYMQLPPENARLGGHMQKVELEIE